MTDPRRLGSEDPEAAALFAAARAYRPPARARRRILRALGIPVGLSLLGSALAHAAQALAPFKGWIVAGTIAAASAGGGMAYLGQREAAPLAVTEDARAARKIRPRAAARPVPAASTPVAVVEPPPAAPVVVAPVAPVRPAPPQTSARAARIPRQVAQTELPRPAPPAPPPAVPEPPPAPASAVAIAPPPLEARPSFTELLPPPAPAPRALPRSTLDLELTLIEKARGELERASPRRALVTLDEYARSFPGGALLEESELLRLSALKASGAHLEAVAAAEAFLIAHPRSPLAARARTFLPVDSSK